MATKSAEGETTERKKTEFMDISTEILATADFTANEDEEEEEDDEEEEEEDEEEEEEEEEVDSCESDQEWDVDSFKDEDFHSSDLTDDEDLRRYVRQCYKSEVIWVISVYILDLLRWFWNFFISKPKPLLFIIIT